jgi:hypothetical protein
MNGVNQSFSMTLLFIFIKLNKKMTFHVLYGRTIAREEESIVERRRRGAEEEGEVLLFLLSSPEEEWVGEGVRLIFEKRLTQIDSRTSCNGLRER